MAVRRVTRSYGSVVEFLEDHRSTLGQGALLLPPDPARGELSGELKLDLIVPPLGRLGPIDAQVVNRGSDGSAALRIPAWPPTIQGQIDALLQAVDDLRAWFQLTGQLVPPQAQQPAAVAAPSPRVPSSSAPARTGPAPRQGRGFPVPDLTGLAPSHSGAVGDEALRQLFVSLAIEKATGLLTLTQPGGRVRYGFWAQGGPVGWRTEPLEESEVLGILLFKADQVTRDQLRDSLEIMQREGCRQGEAFIQLGVMTFPQLVMVLGKQCEFVLQKVLRETGGSFTFHPIEALPERFLPSPLRVPGMLFRTLLQRARDMKGDALFETLSDYLDRFVSVPPGAVELLPEMRFNPVETRFIDTIRGGSWRIRELYAVSPMSRALTAAVLNALIQLDFLAFTEQQDDSRTFAEFKIIIDRKRSQIVKGSHFDVLEVHWICLPDEIHAAHARLKEEFAPERFSRLGEPTTGYIRLINERLDQAHSVLSDERRRREYRREVIEEMKVTQSAELLGKQGDMAVMRNDRRAAMACYGKAAELVPGSADYRDGLARARTLTG